MSYDWNAKNWVVDLLVDLINYARIILTTELMRDNGMKNISTKFH